MKKRYDSPEMDITIVCVSEPFSVSSTQPEIKYDDIENWSPIIPPRP